MRVAWINGWSLEEGPLRALATKRFPNDEHVVIASIPGWDRVLENVEGIDVLIGYSLGAFLLMGRPNLCGGAKRTILLAPFEDLGSESERGGRVRRGQLSYLLKWLDRDAVAAVVDFRKRSGISELMSDKFRFSVDQLKWGIEILMTETIDSGAIESFECYVGSEDTLLDAAYFDNAYPRINIVEGAGHDLEALLERGLAEL